MLNIGKNFVSNNQLKLGQPVVKTEVDEKPLNSIEFLKRAIEDFKKGNATSEQILLILEKERIPFSTGDGAIRFELEGKSYTLYCRSNLQKQSVTVVDTIKTAQTQNNTVIPTITTLVPTVVTTPTPKKALTISGVIEDFTAGNMTVDELQKNLKALNTRYDVKTSGGKIIVSFTHAGKKYEIMCSSLAAKDANDNVTAKKYSAEELKKYDSQVVNMFFDAVVIEGKNIKQYVLKDGKTYDQFLYACIDKLDEPYESISVYNSPPSSSLKLSKICTKTKKLLPKLKKNVNSYIEKNFKAGYKTKFIDKFGPLLMEQGLDDSAISEIFDTVYSNAKEVILSRVAKGDKELVSKWYSGFLNNKGNVEINPETLSLLFSKEFNKQTNNLVQEMKNAVSSNMSLNGYTTWCGYVENVTTNSHLDWRNQNKIAEFFDYISTSDLVFNEKNLTKLYCQFTNISESKLTDSDELGISLIMSSILLGLSNSDEKIDIDNFEKNNNKKFSELIKQNDMLQTKSIDWNGTPAGTAAGVLLDAWGMVMGLAFGPVGKLIFSVCLNTFEAVIACAADGDFSDFWTTENLIDIALQTGLDTISTYIGGKAGVKLVTKILTNIGTYVGSQGVANFTLKSDGHEAEESANKAPSGNSVGSTSSSTAEDSAGGTAGSAGSVGSNNTNYYPDMSPKPPKSPEAIAYAGDPEALYVELDGILYTFDDNNKVTPIK